MERIEFLFARLASILEPNCDPKELFYPVDIADWAEVREMVEEAGDPESPLVEEEKLRLAQYAQDKIERLSAEAQRKAAEETAKSQ